MRPGGGGFLDLGRRVKQDEIVVKNPQYRVNRATDSDQETDDPKKAGTAGFIQHRGLLNIRIKRILQPILQWDLKDGAARAANAPSVDGKDEKGQHHADRDRRCGAHASTLPVQAESRSRSTSCQRARAMASAAHPSHIARTHTKRVAFMIGAILEPPDMDSDAP